MHYSTINLPTRHTNRQSVQRYQYTYDTACFSARFQDITDVFLIPKATTSKAETYGLSDSSLMLMQSYFRNRENRTRVGNCTSEWGAVNRGCPRGSSLRPLVWNVYQNDLLYSRVNSQLSAYADDHQL